MLKFRTRNDRRSFQVLTLLLIVEPGLERAFLTSYILPSPYLWPPSPFVKFSRNPASGQKDLSMRHPYRSVYYHSPLPYEQRQWQVLYQSSGMLLLAWSSEKTVNNICLGRIVNFIESIEIQTHTILSASSSYKIRRWTTLKRGQSADLSHTLDV